MTDETTEAAKKRKAHEVLEALLSDGLFLRS